MLKANSVAMLRLLMFLMTLSVRVLRAIFRTREELLIENLVLRQQVAALKKERPRLLVANSNFSWQNSNLSRLVAADELPYSMRCG